MKKLIALLLMSCLIFTLVACGQDSSETNDTSTSDAGQTDTQQSVENETPDTDTEVADDTADTEDTQDTEGASKTLVIYFSNTGNTKAIAENIASGLGADIHEIVAEVPYTSADLDYGDNNSRSTLEMNDPSARPAISGSVDNMDEYDTIYIGYPIWWGEAPRILSTFVESYDFTDKTVVPFCTSSSSGVGSSASRLAETAGTGNWLDGKRFSGNESLEEVMEWVNGL